MSSRRAWWNVPAQWDSKSSAWLPAGQNVLLRLRHQQADFGKKNPARNKLFKKVWGVGLYTRVSKERTEFYLFTMWKIVFGFTKTWVTNNMQHVETERWKVQFSFQCIAQNQFENRDSRSRLLNKICKMGLPEAIQSLEECLKKMKTSPQTKYKQYHLINWHEVRFKTGK